jgi:hypothetical protein
MGIALQDKLETENGMGRVRMIRIAWKVIHSLLPWTPVASEDKVVEQRAPYITWATDVTVTGPPRSDGWTGPGPTMTVTDIWSVGSNQETTPNTVLSTAITDIGTPRSDGPSGGGTGATTSPGSGATGSVNGGVRVGGTRGFLHLPVVGLTIGYLAV